MSMMCRPMWPFLLMYGSHDMRHIGFSQVDSGQRDPREMGASHGTMFLVLLAFMWRPRKSIAIWSHRHLT